MIWDLDKYSHCIAVVDEVGTEYTYSEIKLECEKLINNMNAGRCLVFNLCSNEVGSLVGYVAFVNSRIVPLLLDAHLDRELLTSLIESYKPDYLWVPSSMVSEFEYTYVYSSLNYTLVKTPYKSAYPLNDQLALLLTTSGSTGSPKLVRQSYINIEANTQSIVKYLEIDKLERAITTLPMSYTYGLSIINSHLYVGASIIMTKKTLMEKDIWRQFKEYEATSFGGVPYIYEMLDKLRFFRMNLPSLRTMTQAGGKLSPELHRKFTEFAQKTGKRFIVMYGQTEATARMAYLPYERSLEKCGSMGIAIPGGRFKLADIDGKEVTEPEVIGELIYEGANVTLGYAECGDDLIKGDERQGILVTGDMAKRDEDGYYYIVGRKKRFLKMFGSRVNLMEVESLLGKQGYETACVGEDDHMRIYTTSHDITELHNYISQTTGINRIAFEVIHIDEIPRNESGKVLYSELT